MGGGGPANREKVWKWERGVGTKGRGKEEGEKGMRKRKGLGKWEEMAQIVEHRCHSKCFGVG